MGTLDPIRIEGIREFSRSLRQISTDLPKALRIAANAGANIVVDAAKPRVPTGPGKGGHAATSLKAASTRSEARVQGGGKKFPYYPWLDFGGRVGRKKSIKRPFIRKGRYIWAAFSDHSDEVYEKLMEEFTNLVHEAGLTVEE